MRDLFKKMLLNYEHDTFNHPGNDLFVLNKEVDGNSWQRSNVHRNLDQDKSTTVYDNQQIKYHSVFNTDTKLSALNGLSIWEFTAVLIALIIAIALFVWTIKKIIILMVNRDHEPLTMNDSFNSKCPNRYDVVHKSFSVDSYEQLTENIYSNRNKCLPDIV